MYVTRSGDTWDIIAKEVYGDELRADVLMKANRKHIATFFFESGLELATPDLLEERDGSLPPWKYGADNV